MSTLARGLFSLAVVAAAALSALPAVAQDVAPAAPFEATFRNVAPGVVRIVSGRRFASGLLVSEDGLIVTNREIVTRNVLTVYFPGGEKAEARALLRDEPTDLAVLQLLVQGNSGADKPAEAPATGEAPAVPTESAVAPPPAEPAKPAPPRRPVPIGSPGDVRTGSWVATVAYPTGTDAKTIQQPSISAGLLSARGKIPTKLGYDGDLLLTDAAVNLGSEGGALVDADGKVVGVICRPQFNEATGTALNVALPVDVLPALLKRARENPDPPIAEEEFAARKNGFLGIIRAPRSERCRVGGLVPGGPAEKAGLKAGDVIVRIGEEKIDNFEDLIKTLADTKPGDKVTIAVERQGREGTLDIEVELGKYPEQE